MSYPNHHHSHRPGDFVPNLDLNDMEDDADYGPIDYGSNNRNGLRSDNRNGREDDNGGDDDTESTQNHHTESTHNHPHAIPRVVRKNTNGTNNGNSYDGDFKWTTQSFVAFTFILVGVACWITCTMGAVGMGMIGAVSTSVVYSVYLFGGNAAFLLTVSLCIIDYFVAAAIFAIFGPIEGIDPHLNMALNVVLVGSFFTLSHHFLVEFYDSERSWTLQLDESTNLTTNEIRSLSKGHPKNKLLHALNGAQGYDTLKEIKLFWLLLTVLKEVFWTIKQIWNKGFVKAAECERANYCGVYTLIVVGLFAIGRKAFLLYFVYETVHWKILFAWFSVTLLVGDNVHTWHMKNGRAMGRAFGPCKQTPGTLQIDGLTRKQSLVLGSFIRSKGGFVTVASKDEALKTLEELGFDREALSLSPTGKFLEHYGQSLTETQMAALRAHCDMDMNKQFTQAVGEVAKQSEWSVTISKGMNHKKLRRCKGVTVCMYTLAKLAVEEAHYKAAFERLLAMEPVVASLRSAHCGTKQGPHGGEVPEITLFFEG